MSTSTAVYQLVKPDDSESADVAVLNDNMDKVEAGLVGHDTDIASIQTSVDAIPPVQLKRKTSVKAIQSSITPSTDSQLTLAVVAGKEYILEGYIPYNLNAGTSTSVDMQMRILYPGGRAYYTAMGMTVGSADATNGNMTVDTRIEPSGTNPSIFQFACVGTDDMGVFIKGTFEIDTSGNIEFQFAQVTSSTTTLNIYRGAWVRLEEDI